MQEPQLEEMREYYSMLGTFLEHLYPMVADEGIEIKGFGVRSGYYYVDLFENGRYEGQVVRYWGYLRHLLGKQEDEVDFDLMLGSVGAIEKFLTSTPSSPNNVKKPVMEYICKEDEYEEPIPLWDFIRRLDSGAGADGRSGS
ncbi:hypothetical protein L1O03_00115 [Corynebacterium uropygiale]|uniref:Uncharacterized protein n=1 Tax=Corynebacterium uropygiale TaxID=1775911 RepID=A0A9X1QMC8_9CORY|nr:hypothetical protein [Corynebacterium uropygiale]MCF4005591.1 hypothetical protein [Corynebacterium uropygiale]